jgi:signal peptidase I
MKSKTKKILALSLVVVVLVVVATIAGCLFFFRMVRVPTGSMANTIIPGDRLLVRRHVFGQIEIRRGDLIVYGYPKNPSEKRISRVVGLPGESIELRGTSVFINGKELPEQRVTIVENYDREASKELQTEGSGPYRVYYVARDEGAAEQVNGIFGTNGPFAIPANEYYVMGDNRDNSEDSRYWGTLPQALIFGKPTMIYWSESDNPGYEKSRSERAFKKIQ